MRLLRSLPNPGERRRKLREIIEERVAEPVIGVFSPLVALMAEEAGFNVIYISGAALSASKTLPDLGLLTLSEVVDEAREIASSTSLPLIVDVDTGFGETINVMRTVRELEEVGAAGIQIEDQEMPKKCGHLEGKHLIPVDAMAAKIRAAVNTRRDKNFVVVARTDARGVEGLESAIKRAKEYLDAGADVIMPEALESLEEFRRFSEEVEAPLLANMTEFGKSPILSRSRLRELGYSLVLYPLSLFRVAMASVEHALDILRSEESQEPLISKMMTRKRLYQLIRYNDYEGKIHLYEKFLSSRRWR